MRDGYYAGSSARTFWIVAAGERVGLVRAYDCGPLFDLRIRPDMRGRGIGAATLDWLTGYLFTELPHITRIEGQTRRDNHAMRKVFRGGGYVREAHYREAWPGSDGTVHDSVGYAILRRDWYAGTTTQPAWDE
ncbi:MAG TPA: GNAT family protein [Mycobacteriales bacterium]|nr:GNAT family protein [Mycobacteriales bacterium]